MAFVERDMKTWSGWLGVLAGLALGGAAVWLLSGRGGGAVPLGVGLGAAALLIGASLVLAGLFIVNPNEARVCQFFGRYVGTVRLDGFHWANPLLVKRRVSLRVQNFETGRLKVNDVDGNPIEIAAVVVWRVRHAAAALFEVEDCAAFMRAQAEAAVRSLATSYPYDAHDEQQVSLRGHTAAVSEHLKKEVQDRGDRAGVDVLEARLLYLAYAPEIAHAMLQRQQAGAIIAARQRIVEGAVSMVQMALEQLSRQKIVELDEERKAQMVSNLLVVLCGDRSTQPVVNAGTLYG